MRKMAAILLVVLGACWPKSLLGAPFASGRGDEAIFRGFEDDAGGFYIVWTQGTPDKTVGLYAQHLDPTGKQLWDSGGLLVAPHLASAQDWSGLADGQGGLTLFWNETSGIRAQRFLADGSRKRSGPSVLMSTSTAIQPCAVPDADGGTLIVWREFLPTGRSVLHAQRLDIDGQPVWAQGGIRVSLRASNQTNPRVVYDNMSGLIVAWRDEVNSASEMRVQRMDFSGNRLWGLEGLKVTAPMGRDEFPQLAPLGTGAAVLAWTGSFRQTSQIFIQKIGADAALQWESGTLVSNAPATFNRWNALLLGDELGGVWVAWEDFRNQLNYQMTLNHFHNEPVSSWPDGEIKIAPATGDQGKAAMAHDGHDGVWLAWIDNRNATISLYVQEIGKDGSRLLGSSGRLIASRLSKPSVPQIITLESGKAVVLWAERPKKGQWVLQWSRIETP